MRYPFRTLSAVATVAVLAMSGPSQASEPSARP